MPPSDCQIFRNPPLDFKAQVVVSSCYFECEGRFLLLKRHPDKSQGEKWGVPAGKLEPGESPLQALLREVHEEIGLTLEEKNVEFITTLFIRLPWVEYAYHMFSSSLKTFPRLNLALDEHTESRWVTFKEALDLPLILGAETALALYQDFLSSKKP